MAFAILYVLIVMRIKPVVVVVLLNYLTACKSWGKIFKYLFLFFIVKKCMENCKQRYNSISIS